MLTDDQFKQLAEADPTRIRYYAEGSFPDYRRMDPGRYPSIKFRSIGDMEHEEFLWWLIDRMRTRAIELADTEADTEEFRVLEAIMNFAWGQLTPRM
jgi:hypothetical protein